MNRQILVIWLGCFVGLGCPAHLIVFGGSGASPVKTAISPDAAVAAASAENASEARPTVEEAPATTKAEPKPGKSILREMAKGALIGGGVLGTTALVTCLVAEWSGPELCIILLGGLATTTGGFTGGLFGLYRGYRRPTRGLPAPTAGSLAVGRYADRRGLRETAVPWCVTWWSAASIRYLPSDLKSPSEE